MRTAIVYYTLEGHVEKVCRAVAERLGATLVELRCTQPHATHVISPHATPRRVQLTPLFVHLGTPTTSCPRTPPY